MSGNYHSIAFTESVQGAQVQYGSRAAIDRADRHATAGDGSEPLGPARDALSIAEQEFLAERDGFYLATVSESGWPYVQFRGGPAGFVTCPDAYTVVWADFRGNRQYISTGNVAHDPRVAMIFLDYVHQRRLKVFGTARISDAQHQAPRADLSGYRAIVEREVRVEVTAFDWNCPQHITPRYTAEELKPVLEPLRRRVGDLETENEHLRAQVAALSPIRDTPSLQSESGKDEQ
jgi:predicted pyridoxine 5'-phosphate oxidase superfamily flavin-nucleotide-binding protein